MIGAPVAIAPGSDSYLSDQDFVWLFDGWGFREFNRRAGWLEIKTYRRAAAHAFGETFGVRQDVDGAQRLRIAFQQHPLARVGAERGGDDLITQPQLHEIQ